MQIARERICRFMQYALLEFEQIRRQTKMPTHKVDRHSLSSILSMQQ
jgi:hypothetical protein